MDVIDLLDRLRSIPTPSGFEDRGDGAVLSLLSPFFDEGKRIGVNSLLFTKKCGKEKAKRVLIDAHFDELGLIVTSVREDGLLTASKLGGFDPRTFTASKFTLHAKEELCAVALKEPYLPSKSKKLPKPGEFLLFTGLTKEELTDLGVRVGTPASFERFTEKLGEDQYYGPYMDDKSCAVCAVYAVEALKGKKLCCDVCLLLSSQEESYGAGFPTGAYAAEPDEIIVVDVDLGFTPETGESETVKPDNGASVAISVQTDRKVTKELLRVAGERQIPVQPTMNVRSTGTNASGAPFLAGGIPTAVVGLPLKYMHTQTETLYKRDVEAVGNLIAAYIESRYGEGGGAQ